MTHEFRHLTGDEFPKTLDWYAGLRGQERPLIDETLRVLNEFVYQLEPEAGVVPRVHELATIGAGSSLYTDTYTDIDLFMVPKDRIERYWGACAHPQRKFTWPLSNTLPEGAVPFRYRAHSSFDEEELSRMPPEYYHRFGLPYPGDVKTLAEIEKGVPALVTVSLIYEPIGLDKRREGHPDDILVPLDDCMPAEQFIRHNREQGSKFVVLSRQYEP